MLSFLPNLDLDRGQGQGQGLIVDRGLLSSAYTRSTA